MQGVRGIRTDSLAYAVSNCPNLSLRSEGPSHLLVALRETTPPSKLITHPEIQPLLSGIDCALPVERIAPVEFALKMPEYLHPESQTG